MSRAAYSSSHAPYFYLDIFTVCLPLLTAHIMFELRIRDRNRGMFSSISVRFAYSFQKSQGEKVKEYIALLPLHAF